MARQPGTTRNPRTRRPPHAPLTDVPVGAIAIAAVLDVFSAGEGVDHPVAPGTYRAATFVLMIGTAVLFVGLGILSILDLVVRRNDYGDSGSSPGVVVALALSCLAVTVVGGTLGGGLVRRAGFGVSGLRTSDVTDAAVKDSAPSGDGTARR